MPQFLEFSHNHLALFVALGVVMLAFIVNEAHGRIGAPKRISPLDAVRLINDQDALILDVRAHGDYRKSHLMNAVNMPLAKLDERMSELGKEKARPIIVYCTIGSTASEAARKIAQHGYTAVFPLRGGLEGWHAANLPTTAK